MEMENIEKNKMKKIEEIGEFADEFCEFRKQIAEKTNGSAIGNEEIVTLYAIFRKDARTDKINGNGNKPKSDPTRFPQSGNAPISREGNRDAPATEKQINAIKALMHKGKIETDAEFNIDALTKREASEILSKAFGDEKSPFSLHNNPDNNPEIPKLYETENTGFNDKIIYQKWGIKQIGFYWLIAEYDEKQELAFGYANLNNNQNAEWGTFQSRNSRRTAQWRIKNGILRVQGGRKSMKQKGF